MNALGKAAQPLVPQLEQYGIRVIMSQGTVISPMGIVVFRRFTPAFICRLYLKYLIRKLK